MTADGFASSLGSGEEEYAVSPGAFITDWTDNAPTDDREAQDVEALSDLIAGPDPFAIAEAILASDWLAARERAAAEKARADERERIALAIEAERDDPMLAPADRYYKNYGLTVAANRARSKP